MFPASTYLARRAALRAKISGGLILMPGNHNSPMNYRENVFPFRQDSSFLNFFGLDQPGLVGLMDLDSGEDWLIGQEPTLDDVIWSAPLPSLADRAAEVGITRTGSQHMSWCWTHNAMQSPLCIPVCHSSKRTRSPAACLSKGSSDRLRRIGGIRVEDDVLITESGSRVLGPRIAKTANEVEAAMSD